LSWVSKVLLAVVGIVFLLKGGFTLVLALWRFLLPLALVAGGIYLLKGYLAEKKKLKQQASREPIRDGQQGVIQICPHCLQEVGSCPRCRP
jgi:hypothetical protein